LNAVRWLTREANRPDSLASERPENESDADSGLRLSQAQVVNLVNSRTRERKNLLERNRKVTTRLEAVTAALKQRDLDTISLTKKRNKEIESGVRLPFTPEESLSYKIHNLISDRQYQVQKNSFGSLAPLSEAKDVFETLTEHVALEEIKTATKEVIGYKTTLKQVLEDAIRTDSMGIADGVINEMKLTGDGGRLCPRYPMTCLFVQSLMMEVDQQGLRSASPLAIMTASEDYETIERATVGFGTEIREIEQHGLMVNKRLYRFKFTFCADLKFMWLVTFHSFLQRDGFPADFFDFSSGFGAEAQWLPQVPVLYHPLH